MSPDIVIGGAVIAALLIVLSGLPGAVRGFLGFPR